jgi:hypothetical protein
VKALDGRASCLEESYGNEWNCMNIKQWFWLSRRRYSPLELRLLSAIREVLPVAARPIFDSQVKAVTRMQRDPGWAQIAYYRLRFGKVNWIGVPMFPRQGEFPLADVRFEVGGRPFTAKLTVLRGHVFDFGIWPSPRAIAFDDWDSSGRARLLSDPMDETASEPSIALPESWREFLAGRNGDTDWTLHDISTAYTVTLDDGEYLVLAECEGDFFLLYRVNPLPGEYHALFGHDNKPEAWRASLTELLRTTPSERS